jgi:hypothetical protein
MEETNQRTLIDYLRLLEVVGWHKEGVNPGELGGANWMVRMGLCL